MLDHDRLADPRWLALAAANAEWVTARRAVWEYQYDHGLRLPEPGHLSPAEAVTLRRLREVAVEAHRVVRKRFEDWRSHARPL